MERRALLKKMAVIGLGSALPLHTLFAGKSFSGAERPYHRFRLGDLELMVVTDGHIVMSPVQQHFAQDAPAAEVNKLLEDNFRSTKAVDLGMNILIVKKGKDIILIDTGAGYGFGPDSGWLPASLKDAGIHVNDVTQIVITHAHPDHIGGLFTRDNKLVFPNAQVYMAAIELQFWMSADQSDFARSKFSDKELLAKILVSTKHTLAALKDRLHLFDHTEELFGCIRLQLAAGHTPGHTLVRIFSGKEEIVHIADLLHSDVLLFPHPEWGFDGDTDFDMAAVTRRKVMEALAVDRTTVFSYHLPWPGIGHVRKKGDGYEWVAETYAFPV
ncbi:MBL fold metallo-hydrolase [Chitinophaga filiformis]|uniref:Glyoxylase, beta-lactamase superfamily II n=1 Tax=Chitinophaga filiformis TaxID=104663 RepID=A0A1G7P6G7_CHIFI|nr:MBL fold metallo-hydrolase [Chitinophaga filiformis]SDF81737.1 Glyoxylase, beta-lactamase superfamily II [Chitinophaga filiformis]